MKILGVLEAVEKASKIQKNFAETGGIIIDNIGKGKDLVFSTLDDIQNHVNKTRDLKIKEICDAGVILNDQMKDNLEQENIKK